MSLRASMEKSMSPAGQGGTLALRSASVFRGEVPVSPAQLLAGTAASWAQRKGPCPTREPTDGQAASPSPPQEAHSSTIMTCNSGWVQWVQGGEFAGAVGRGGEQGGAVSLHAALIAPGDAAWAAGPAFLPSPLTVTQSPLAPFSVPRARMHLPHSERSNSWEGRAA